MLLARKILKKVYRRPLIIKDINYKDQDKLTALQRYEAANINFMGVDFSVVDNVTFIASYLEIFRENVYSFETKTIKPVMIDCGANIGLATIYLKQNHPDASIVAFEPDPKIFDALQNNIKAFGFKDITCLNKAVSSEKGILNFSSEGGHAGKLSFNNNVETIKVEAIRLKEFLQQYETISFLKIDIEGHEKDLIPDIAEELLKVEFLFLEYHSFIDEPQCLEEMLTHLKNAGFRYYLKEGYPKMNPFSGEEIFGRMDFMVNIYCFRK